MKIYVPPGIIIWFTRGELCDTVYFGDKKDMEDPTKEVVGIKLVLPEPGFAPSLKVILKIRDQVEEIDLTAMAIVYWPVDVHIDENGAIATFKMRVTEIEGLIPNAFAIVDPVE